MRPGLDMKFSELDFTTLADFAGVSDLDDVTTKNLQLSLSSAKGFVRNYTNANEEYLDKNEELAIVTLAIASDFYLNREFTGGNFKSI